MTHQSSTLHRYALAAATVLIAVAGNLIFSIVFPLTFHLPLFMDSIMTVAVTLFSGLIPGIAAGILYNVLWPFVTGGDPRQAIFACCSVATAVFTHLWIAKRKGSWILTDLLMLSLIIGFANSVLGGIISTFAFRGVDSFPSDYIMAGMLMQDIPLVGAAILARIPLNLIDKGIAVFLGYGIYLLADRLMRRSRERA
jgi:energy-coupling factor transport system substrate-specific component